MKREFKPGNYRIFLISTFLIIAVSINLSAQLKLNHIFDNNMVLQRDKPVRVWGWGDSEKKVTVEFSGQIKETTIGTNNAWEIYLDPMDDNIVGQLFKVTSEGDSFVYQNVVIGDVWILTGQSNMEFDLARIHHGDEEIVSANFPLIRLMTIPAAAGPEPLPDFNRLNEWDGWYERYDLKGYWLVCTPKTVPTYSGIGYVFGRRLFMASQVPIGLVDASWGGTTIEGFIPRDKLMEVPENAGLLKLWDERIIADPEKANDRNNPGAAFNGMMNVFGGLSVKGIIWHQGFNNALGDSRPKLYTKNLQLMIQKWRETFRDENLAFGIIELSAGGEPQTLDNFALRMLDAGTYIREAQLKAYIDLPAMGFVSAYDEQVNWYHPQKKVELGERIARWALATQYGFDFGWEPALVIKEDVTPEGMIIGFDKEVMVPDGRPIEGLALAGKDKKFYHAQTHYLVTGKDDKGKDIIDRTKLVVTSKKVKKPIACRYAWARNPLGNLTNAAHHERVIPVPPFRTDKWDWPEAPFAENKTQEFMKHREVLREMKKKVENGST